MQFLAALHILFTCSVVVLLAYLLSRVFTYLAHSVIHGSDVSRRSREGSSRRRSSESFKTQIEDQGAMARLQEADEDNNDKEEEHAYRDAEVYTTTRMWERSMGGGIFDDRLDQGCKWKRDDGNEELWDNEEGMKGAWMNDGRYEAGGGATEVEYKDKEVAEENEEKGAGAGSESRLGDAQGSSSLQQRLPPTWAELERIVNMSSKQLSPPAPTSD